MQLLSLEVMLKKTLGQLQCNALSTCMTIYDLIQRLVTQQTENIDEEKQDLDILLQHIAELRGVSQTLVEQFHQEQKRCERQAQFVLDLSRRVRESISILCGSAWMLDVHGNHIKSETRQKHYSTILQAMGDLKHQLHRIHPWQDQLFDLEPILIELEKLGTSSPEEQDYDAIKPAHQRTAKPRVRCDPQVLKIILDEVLDNAFKFSSGTKPVECQILRSDRQVQLSVRDYGPGIPDSEKLNIFKSFYRAPNAGEAEGYGLGLSIVRKLVSDYGGTILLKSKLGKGTEIVISIPLEAEMRSPKPGLASRRGNPYPRGLPIPQL